MDGRELMIVVNTALICGTILVGIALQAWASRRARKPAPQSTDAIESRLARMEQAIDTIAVEVERIAEGQRFTTKLLSEGRGDVVPVPRSEASRGR
jgi:hypothetical protein